VGQVVNLRRIGNPPADNMHTSAQSGLGRSEVMTMNREILVDMEHFTLHIDKQGRVMLPAWWRRRVGVSPSTELCVAVTEEGTLVLETREQGLRRARTLLRKYIPEGVNLSDELIAERRAEAARESEQS
jgi:bifunctional DNA-binding transcriptional regulator/antitoxin component of YhaV-PrlF toxin-antitoxin module